MSDYSKLHCSFCGKTTAEVKKLIESEGTHICDNCIDICYAMLHPDEKAVTDEVEEESTEETETEEDDSQPSPREIKEFLDQYVIGQDYAKEVISVAVYNHYKRLKNPIIDGVEIEKSNILLLGPTGSGKTLLAQSVARMLDVPFTIVDATSLTEAGYVGEDVETVVSRLLYAADNDVKKAERGIIFLDEIDKKKSTSSGSSIRDVSGEGVQQALLKLLEGSEIMVPQSGRKGPTAEMFKINTKNILFIVGGAFVGLDKIIEKSSTKDVSGIGFGSTLPNKTTVYSEIIKQVEPEHLVTFGLIPELVGRLPIVTPLDDLDEKQLVRVLTEPKNALIKQFCMMFRLDGIKLVFDDNALLAVAKIARSRKTGGRALRSVLEKTLMKIQFNLPDLREKGVKKIHITEETIKGADAIYDWE